MRIALIFAIFAPIQLCSFRGNERDWRDTWTRRDTGARQDSVVSIDSPANNTIVARGETVILTGSGDFVGAFPDQIEAAWFRPDQAEPFCWSNLNEFQNSLCTFTVPPDDDQTAYRLQFQIRAPWGQTEDAFVNLVVEEEQPEPVGPPVLTIGSPPASSLWSESSVVPFVATLRAGETPLEDARIVWEVDGLQVATLTARTDNQGTVVAAAAFAVGPHEALATVFVNDEPITASTRFVVTEDVDTDTDTDLDSDSDADSDSDSDSGSAGGL